MQNGTINDKWSMKFQEKFKVPNSVISGKFEIMAAQIRRRFSYKWSLIALREHITVQMDSQNYKKK